MIMICRDKIIFSCLVACGLGAAGGYLFSSKFCKVTIVKRVAKEVVLNQTLRQLLAEHAFLIHNVVRSVFFNTPDQQAVSNRLLKNQEDLNAVFATYYGQSSAQQLNQLVAQNTKLIEEIAKATQENKQLHELTNAWKKNSDAIATLLAQINPEWAIAHDTLKAGLDHQLSLITQEVDALQKNNWQRSIEIFKKHFDFAMQLADEIDKGITMQFPQKF